MARASPIAAAGQLASEKASPLGCNKAMRELSGDSVVGGPGSTTKQVPRDPTRPTNGRVLPEDPTREERGTEGPNEANEGPGGFQTWRQTLNTGVSVFLKSDRLAK